MCVSACKISSSIVVSWELEFENKGDCWDKSVECILSKSKLWVCGKGHTRIIREVYHAEVKISNSMSTIGHVSDIEDTNA